jgi:maltooligosyltrehalose synthase
MQPEEAAPVGERFWGNSAIRPDIDGELVNVLTGEPHAGGELRLAELLSVFPVALLVKS